MCDNTQNYCYDGVNTTPVTLYATPTFPTNDCYCVPDTLYQQPLQPICKPPERIHGLPVELAVRKAPFNGYPQRNLHKPVKLAVRNIKSPEVCQYKPPDPDLAMLQKSVDGPGWTPRFCLRRINSLLLRVDTAKKFEDRVWALWTLYEKIAKNGFIYDNMDIVANIMLALSTSFIRLPYAQNLFEKVLQRLQRGIYLKSALKDPVDVKKLAYCFTVLGLAIVEGHPHAQAAISTIISIWLENIIEKRQPRFHLTTITNFPSKKTCFLSSHPINLSGDKSLMMTPDNVLVTALEKSLLPRTVCKYFSDGSHTEGYISILTMLKTCCDVSPVIRNRLLHVPVLDPILLKLAIVDRSNRILLTTSDFIHSYFRITDLDPHHNNSDENPNESFPIIPILEKDTFQILLTRFVQQLGQCSSKSLLNVRNDVAFLVCLICEQVPASGEYFEGFGMLVASIVSSSILGMKGLDMLYLIDSTPEDLELLQYLIYMLKCIVTTECGQNIIEEYSVVASLLRLILGPCHLTTTPSGGNVVIGGEGEKGNDLENSAWTTIHAIAKHCPLSLLTPHGVPSLLTYLKAYGEVGDGDQRMLAMSMHTIRIILTTPQEDSCVSDEVTGYFIQRNGMDVFLGILRQLTKENFDMLQETVISNALYCCAALAYYDYNQKEVFVSLEGVTILTQLMRHLLCHSADRRHMNPGIQMAVAECVICCVNYYPRALEGFVANEGVFRLLDILEFAADPAAPIQLVNCVLQLCDYHRCMDQLLCWRRPLKSASKRVVFGQDLDGLARSSWRDDVPSSEDNLQELRARSNQNLSSMLCALWKEEEGRFDVLRDPEGCIESIIHPLMSKFARSYDQTGEYDISRSTLDMSLSLRPKIFLLIKRIVEVTNTEAILFDGLSLSNQVVMQVILNFVDLKKSEIYLEIVEEIERQGEPSLAPSDDEGMYKLTDIARNTLATVLETQRYLIRRYNEKEEINENEFYAMIKQCRLQDHLLAATEIELLARTTNYQFLVEKRLWQKSEFECAVKELNTTFTKNSRIHRLSDGGLNITAWPCRTRYLVSEPKMNEEDATLENYDDNDDVTFLETNKDYDNDNDDNAPIISDNASILTIEPSLSSVGSKLDIIPSVSINMNIIEAITPEPLEGGFYQISPHRLREALKRLVSYQRKHAKWMNLAEQDEETFWKLRTKWRKDWYPLGFEEQIPQVQY